MGPSTAEFVAEPLSLREQLIPLHQEFKRAHDAGENRDGPSLRLGLALYNKIHGTEKLVNEDQVHKLVADINQDFELDSAQYFADFIGTANLDELKKKYQDHRRACATRPDGSLIPIEEFEKLVGPKQDIINTGHPTYFKDPVRQDAFAALIAHRAGSKNHGPETRAKLIELAKKTSFKTPNAAGEFAQNLHSLRNEHFATKLLRDWDMEIGKELYPQTWHTIDYYAASKGTWVFHDLDGRQDFTWDVRLTNLMLLQILQLQEYINDFIPEFEAVKAEMSPEDREEIENILKKIKTTHDLVSNHHEFMENYDQNKDEAAQFPELKYQYTNIINERNSGERLTSPLPLIEKLRDISSKPQAEKVQDFLVRFRSDLVGQGLCYAKPHLRLSSTAVRQALKAKWNIDIGDNESTDKLYLDKIEKIAAGTTPQRVNLFEDVVRSNIKLHTSFSLINFWCRNFDSYTPNKVLLADWHNAATLAGTAAYAKQLDVIFNTDISPLVEDAIGSKNIMKDLQILVKSNSIYKTHLITPRPHSPGQRWLEIQYGYSDYAVDCGQLSAGAEHEANIVRLIYFLSEKREELNGLGLMIFHTGGQNPSRGQNPLGNYETEMYQNSPHVLNTVRRLGVPYRSQRSLQGAGQAVAGQPELATAILVTSNIHLTTDYSHIQDPQYSVLQRPVHSFTERVRVHHRDLMGSDDVLYLTAKYQNTARGSGSRPNVAQDDGQQRQKPKLRAIKRAMANQIQGSVPHISAGIGKALVNPDEDNRTEVEGVLRDSEYFRKIRFAFVVYELRKAIPSLRESYNTLFDPAFWHQRARQAVNEKHAKTCYAVASLVQEIGDGQRFKKVIDDLREDSDITRKFLEESKLGEHPDFDRPTMRVTATQKMNLEIAHGARMYAMMRWMELAVEIPDIAEGHNSTRDRIVRDMMDFVAKAVDEVEDVYRSNGHGKGNVIDFPLEPSDTVRPPGYYDVASHLDQMRSQMEIMRNGAEVVSNYYNSYG